MRVLSIDGGGIRGLVPALVLAEIEDRTSKPISEVFDLISGTSTGGIIALGLTMPGADGPRYSARDLARLYEEKGDDIFSRPVSHRLRSGGGTLEEKYPSGPVEEVLKEYFASANLKSALTEVFVTSYDVEKALPFFFRSYRARQDPAYDFPMWEVARATSAAPTYFEPLRLDAAPPDDFYALVDGGVFANNPAMCAYVEARKRLESEDPPAPPDSEFLFVSLGTGQLTRAVRYEEAKDWGLFGWARPILDVVFDGVSDTVDFQLTELLGPKEGTRRYYRFQAPLEKDNAAMDDAGPENIHALRQFAENIIQEHAGELDALCDQLGRAALP
jgi:uncharacterized protein